MTKYLNYFRYILIHKWHVFWACLGLGLPVWVALAHDLSKFLPDEFLPYAEFFYGKGGNQEAFDLAWLLHQRRNPHHWQYWTLLEDSGKVKLIEMPNRYKREMLADWRGAGKAINGKDDTANCYLKNRSKILLYPATRDWIEQQLNLQLESWKPGDIEVDLKLKIMTEERDIHRSLWMNATAELQKAMPDYDGEGGWIFAEAAKRIKKASQ